MEEQVARFRADLEALIGGAPEKLGVAVSGGPDSLALLLLAASAWPGRIAAATVDHGLRPESAAEAAFVARVCAELGVPHRTLRAEMAATANLQANARERRYALLADWLAEIDAAFVATAHHLDDQAETMLMRLVRGAGLAGLSGIRAVNPPVVRPLLGWRREELAAIVRAAGLAALLDPSNEDPRFDRTRVRRRLAEAGWLDPTALARSAGALAEAEQAVEWMTERLWDERVEAAPELCTLDPAGLPAELRRRLVVGILSEMSGGAPRGEEVARLLATLAAGGTATLAGIKCAGGERWRFTPAPPRR
ncbi:MAG: tRNA lysidine(34) synthetase TilS [Sphingomonadaceae bacterium]|nr:tRNA lysidine(34) synthetase TilS [Sphingomonadaceae bacterium]